MAFGRQVYGKSERPVNRSATSDLLECIYCDGFTVGSDGAVYIVIAVFLHEVTIDGGLGTVLYCILDGGQTADSEWL